MFSDKTGFLVTPELSPAAPDTSAPRKLWLARATECYDDIFMY